MVAERPLILACGDVAHGVESLFAGRIADVLATTAIDTALRVVSGDHVDAVVTGAHLHDGTAFELLTALKMTAPPRPKSIVLLDPAEWTESSRCFAHGASEVIERADPMALVDALAPILHLAGESELRTPFLQAVVATVQGHDHLAHAVNLRPTGIALRSVPPLEPELAVRLAFSIGPRAVQLWAQAARSWIDDAGVPHTAFRFICVDRSSRAWLRLEVAALTEQWARDRRPVRLVDDPVDGTPEAVVIEPEVESAARLEVARNILQPGPIIELRPALRPRGRSLREQVQSLFEPGAERRSP